MDQWLASRKPVVQSGSFSKLSVELLDLIFEHLAASTSGSRLTEMIFFAITCTAVLEVGERHLLRALRAYHAYWVRGRLVCLSNSLTWGDRPVGLLTDAETHELETALFDWNREEEYGSLYEFALKRYDNCPTHQEDDREVAFDLRQRLYHAEHPTSMHMYKRNRVPASGESWDDIRRFLNIYHAEWPTAEKDAISVLCNLSKAQYVRSDRLPKEDPSDGPWFELDSALLSRICWCGDDEDVSIRCEGEYRERLMRGSWAGDRFCITTLDMLPDVFNGKEGKDVSEETLALLQHIWTLRLKDPAEEKAEEPAQEGTSNKSQTIEDSSDSDDTPSESDTSTEDTSSDDSSSDDTTNDEDTSSEESLDDDNA